jgi:hypothetical protein
MNARSVVRWKGMVAPYTMKIAKSHQSILEVRTITSRPVRMRRTGFVSTHAGAPPIRQSSRAVSARRRRASGESASHRSTAFATAWGFCANAHPGRASGGGLHTDGVTTTGSPRRAPPSPCSAGRGRAGGRDRNSRPPQVVGPPARGRDVNGGVPRGIPLDGACDARAHDEEPRQGITARARGHTSSANHSTPSSFG